MSQCRKRGPYKAYLDKNSASEIPRRTKFRYEHAEQDDVVPQLPQPQDNRFAVAASSSSTSSDESVSNVNADEVRQVHGDRPESTTGEVARQSPVLDEELHDVEFHGLSPDLEVDGQDLVSLSGSPSEESSECNQSVSSIEEVSDVDQNLESPSSDGTPPRRVREESSSQLERNVYNKERCSKDLHNSSTPVSLPRIGEPVCVPLSAAFESTLEEQITYDENDNEEATVDVFFIEGDQQEATEETLPQEELQLGELRQPDEGAIDAHPEEINAAELQEELHLGELRQPDEGAIEAHPEEINAAEVTHTLLRRKIQSDEFTSPISTPVNASPAEALLMVLELSQKNNFTFKAFVDSAKLVNSLFTSPIIANSAYLLDSLLVSSEGIERHFYCKKCFHSFGFVDHKNIHVLVCPERNCQTTNKIKDLTQATYFALFSIPAQVKLLFQDKTIWEQLVNPKDVVKLFQNGVMKDIYDGTCYREFAASLPDNINEKIISFVFCTDGSPLFKSSSYSIWPFFLSINELPPVLRMKHLLIGGLWFGNKHPPMDLFLQPVCLHLRSLAVHGFKFSIGDQEIGIKAYPLACCVDSGARGAVQGINSHSGYYSCNWCEIAGKYIDHKVVFPFQEVPPKPRTHADIVEYARECIEDGHLSYVFGVQYLSPLSQLPKFDLVRGMVQDFAHNVPFGIARTFLQEWLCNTSRGCYIGSPDDSSELDKKMMLLTPPLEVRRRPRKVSDNVHWNAREFENWTLFYSLLVVEGILPLKYWRSWSYLVQATHLLSRQAVRMEDVNNAHKLLLHFIVEVEHDYGESFMSYNLHILSHLAENVTRWGPIFAVSTYAFENGIKDIKGLLHAQRGVAHQIHRALSYKQAAHILRNLCGTPKTEIFEASIESKPNKLTKYLPVEECVLLGSDKIFVANDEEEYLIRNSGFLIDITNCRMYQKIIREKCVYTSEELKTDSKFSNSCAQLTNGNIVIIKKFILDVATESVYLFFVNVNCSTFLRMPQGIQIAPEDHCVRVISYIGRRLNLLPVKELKVVCVKTVMNEKLYVSTVPNICNVF